LTGIEKTVQSLFQDFKQKKVMAKIQQNCQQLLEKDQQDLTPREAVDSFDELMVKTVQASQNRYCVV